MRHNITFMSNLRFEALSQLSLAPDNPEIEAADKVTAIFNENVFTLATARQFLSDEAYKSLVASIKSGKKIDRTMGNQIAVGIRAWAETKQEHITPIGFNHLPDCQQKNTIHFLL